MREERLKSNVDRRSAKKTEPENLAAEDDSSRVNKSRKLELEKAAQRAKMLSEQDNNEEDEDSMDEDPADMTERKNAAGVKVRHGLDQRLMSSLSIARLLPQTFLQRRKWSSSRNPRSRSCAEKKGLSCMLSKQKQLQLVLVLLITDPGVLVVSPLQRKQGREVWQMHGRVLTRVPFTKLWMPRKLSNKRRLLRWTWISTLHYLEQKKIKICSGHWRGPDKQHLRHKAQNSAAGTKSLAVRLAAPQTADGEASEGAGAAGGEDKKKGEVKVVFTDTGEFCRSLQLDEAITRRAGPRDAFGEEAEEPPAVPMEQEVPTAGGWTEVKDAANAQGGGDEARDDKDQQETPIKEVVVGKGLAGALMLLQERGTLKEGVDWAGRNMDKKRSKPIGIVDDSTLKSRRDHREIILDYVDEFGRTMTSKEAYRKLSYFFHGGGPGKIKLEKRMKQRQLELKLKDMNPGDTPLMLMEKLREAQANLHSPYIVISGHVKPGQTSDPRSGFATVEKEPIGSLTPVLGNKHKVGSLTPMPGDKKVMHFLGSSGMKRKHYNASMGPPPPKKPKADY